MADSRRAKMPTHDSPVSATGQPLKGHPVQVVVAGDDHKFTLDEAALEEILLKPNIRDKKVVIVSVAGAFRKGKSFLLDFFLRYLAAEGAPDWLGGDDSPLDGFSWRGGSERDTTGILLWSEPFIMKNKKGEEVAVLLMDTQGAFDSETTVRACATVFALSTMLSSAQVFNLSQNIQEDNLQHLQLFADYGRLAQEATANDCKPFQYLMFLVRDWSFPYEAHYGIEGGQKLLDRRLQISDGQHKELQQLRQHLKACFDKMTCFLMPHPGLRVATNPHFDGRLSDIENDFKEQLNVLVPLLLSRENLVVKEINGSEITCGELEEYFKAYVSIYQGEELPAPKSILDATAEANNLAAVSTSKTIYQTEMDKVCGGDRPYLHPEQLDREHRRIMQEAMDSFHTTRKMGGSDFSQIYADRLQQELEESYHSYMKINESKNIFAAVKTPVVLLLVAFISYIFAWFLGILGLMRGANVANFVAIICVVCILAWSYVRWSGEYRQIALTMDEMAELIWDHILLPAVGIVAPLPAQRRMANGANAKRS